MKRRLVPNEVYFTEVRDHLHAGRTVRVRVQGQSMLPFLRSGSIVTLRPLREGEPVRGDIVFACTDGGHFLIHRVLSIGTERITLLGDGNIRGTESIRPELLYGIVPVSPAARWLGRIWLRMRSLRRWPLALLRRITPK